MLILGIDAAWTSGQPSGIALIQGSLQKWETLAIAPSYGSFIEMAAGEEVNWGERQGGGELGHKVLEAAAKLGGGRKPDLVVADIPLANSPVVKRRSADNAISKKYGGMLCSTHSPSVVCPGQLGHRFQNLLLQEGYPLNTSLPFTDNALIETYPHPVILKLVNALKRVPYKAGKSKKYWPDNTVAERKQLLLQKLSLILDNLNQRIGDIDLVLPEVNDVPSISFLKRYEDALDALVCCWVGMETVAGRADAHGDDDAAIWVPN